MGKGPEMAYTYIIDPPSALAPRAEWQRFLAGVERLPQDDDGVRYARRAAERRIAESSLNFSLPKALN